MLHPIPSFLQLCDSTKLYSPSFRNKFFFRSLSTQPFHCRQRVSNSWKRTFKVHEVCGWGKDEAKENLFEFTEKDRDYLFSGRTVHCTKNVDFPLICMSLETHWNSDFPRDWIPPFCIRTVQLSKCLHTIYRQILQQDMNQVVVCVGVFSTARRISYM